MPVIASDILHPHYLFDPDYNWQPPNEQLRWPAFRNTAPPSNVVRTDPPQLSDRTPGHGGGSEGLQEPANHRYRHEDFEITFAPSGSTFGARQHGYETEGDDETLGSGDSQRRYQMSILHNEWQQWREVFEHQVFERLRQHEADTYYPIDDLQCAVRARREHRESSHPSGSHSPSSTLVNFNTSTPSTNSIIVTSTRTSGSQSPTTLLAGIRGSSPFVGRAPTPRFLWLAPVHINEVACTLRYAPTLAITDDDEESDLGGG